MNSILTPLLSRLRFYVALSIGPFTLALVVSLNGTVKTDVSRAQGNYREGSTGCWFKCNPTESSDGNGKYVGSTFTSGNVVGGGKIYENGASSATVGIRMKKCAYGEMFCTTAGVNEVVADNFDKKKDSVPLEKNKLKSDDLKLFSAARSDNVFAGLIPPKRVFAPTIPTKQFPSLISPNLILDPRISTKQFEPLILPKQKESWTRQIGKQIYDVFHSHKT